MHRFRKTFEKAIRTLERLALLADRSAQTWYWMSQDDAVRKRKAEGFVGWESFRADDCISLYGFDFGVAAVTEKIAKLRCEIEIVSDLLSGIDTDAARHASATLSRVHKVLESWPHVKAELHCNNTSILSKFFGTANAGVVGCERDLAVLSLAPIATGIRALHTRMLDSIGYLQLALNTVELEESPAGFAAPESPPPFIDHAITKPEDSQTQSWVPPKYPLKLPPIRAADFFTKRRNDSDDTTESAESNAPAIEPVDDETVENPAEVDAPPAGGAVPGQTTKPPPSDDGAPDEIGKIKCHDLKLLLDAGTLLSSCEMLHAVVTQPRANDSDASESAEHDAPAIEHVSAEAVESGAAAEPGDEAVPRSDVVDETPHAAATIDDGAADDTFKMGDDDVKLSDLARLFPRSKKRIQQILDKECVAFRMCGNARVYSLTAAEAALKRRGIRRIKRETETGNGKRETGNS